MNKWQKTLEATPLWLLQTFSCIVVVLLLLLLVLRNTQFGGQFWRILKPCLSKKSAAKIICAIAGMVLLLLTEVRLNVQSTYMTNGLYSAMQDLNAHAFWLFAGLNAGVRLLHAFNGVINDFLDQGLAIKWSEKLNTVLLERWLSDKNYYRMQMHSGTKPDNIDQRIQQDAQDFITSTIEFIRGMVSSVVSSIEFAVVLWGLAGVVTILGIHIPHAAVYFVFIVVIVATMIAMWVGRPLIRHNYENEKLNGDYRYALIRVRDHAESVAFYGGEWNETQQLGTRFAAIVRNRWKIARQSVALSGFNDMFSQGMQLLPIILQAPRLLTGQIKIGDVQQTVQSFVRLQRSLSFFRNFYKQFTVYRARLERLSDFLDSMDNIEQPRQPERVITPDRLQLQGVTLYRKNGTVLLQDINLQVLQGQSLLIKGLSGSGKTSLLRVLADLWPFGSEGRVQSPQADAIMFVPQRPYVPQGSLRAAICYPHMKHTPADLLQILQDCRLEELADKLDETQDWQNILSPGELQRIAFIRILLEKPKLILLDEATSALDEQTQDRLYSLLRDKLPQSIIVSTGHRNTLVCLHDACIDLDVYGAAPHGGIR